MSAEIEGRELQNTDVLAALERFVVENDDLLALESRIGRFNIFDALGIKDAEIRHSNFLAFILDPAESHGQGQLFLKAVLMDLLKQAKSELRPLSPIELDGTDLRGVEIRREWEHIDLLIMCQEPPFFVVIENKIWAKEGPEQLDRYEKAMRDHFPNTRPMYVYLTLNAEEASKEYWMPYSHADIYRVLKRVREGYRKAIGEDVIVFLDHYLNLIETRFMNNPEIDKLCQQIYKNHRLALRLIWERTGTAVSGVVAEVANALREDDRWAMEPRGNGVMFLPKAWPSWLPDLGHKDDSWAKPWWIHVWIYSARGSLICCMHVARLTDIAKRKEIVTKLLAEVSGCGLKRPRDKELRDRLSRITVGEHVFDWDEGDEPEPKEIGVAVKKTLDGLHPKLEKLEPILKGLCIS